ncbi:MAG: DsbA family protein [Pseudomonadales bacterium]|nr:DsbA family protein [Pseudomonadales bacterium]
MSIEKLKQNYPVSIRWIPFPLHPETPAEGKSLEELFAGRDIEPMRQRMKELMAEAGLPYGDRTHTYNSRLAQELGKWADTQDGGEAIHDALYRAYFVDNINLYDKELLVGIAEQCGLDNTAAREVLDQRTFKNEVDDDWQRAYQHGITGVPTFYKDDLVVVGCQPYETLERFVKHLLEQSRSNAS